MEITPAYVETIKMVLLNPSEHGFTFSPITECFKKSEKVTPKHILYNQFMEWFKRPLPKLVFYIVMDEIYKDSIGKEGQLGDLGYYLTFNTPI